MDGPISPMRCRWKPFTMVGRYGMAVASGCPAAVGGVKVGGHSSSSPSGPAVYHGRTPGAAFSEQVACDAPTGGGGWHQL